MAPDRPHNESRARAKRAFQLRCADQTWADIADVLGFKSPGSAINAVNRWLRRQPPEDIAAARIYTSGGYRILKATLFEALADAKRRKNNHEIVATSRVLGEVLDKHARLMGLHVTVPQEVNLHVHQSAGQVIDQAQEQLLAIAAARPAPVLPVLDAEVLEVAS